MKANSAARPAQPCPASAPLYLSTMRVTMLSGFFSSSGSLGSAFMMSIQTRIAPVPPVSLVILFWSLPTQTTERRLPENPANQLSR